MLRKLAGYLLLTILSFAFFTGVFHTVANAQSSLADNASLVPKIGDVAKFQPTPTVYQATSQAQNQPQSKQQMLSPLAKISPTPTVFVAQSPSDKQPTPTSEPKKFIATPTLLQPTATPIPSDTPVPQPTTAVASDLDTLFTTYSQQFNVDKEELKKIARCESGFNPTSNNSGMYLGMFQFSAGTWVSTRAQMGLDTNTDLRMNPEEAIRTAAFKISRGGVGAWPNCH